MIGDLQPPQNTQEIGVRIRMDLPLGPVHRRCTGSVQHTSLVLPAGALHPVREMVLILGLRPKLLRRVREEADLETATLMEQRYQIISSIKKENKETGLKVVPELSVCEYLTLAKCPGIACTCAVLGRVEPVLENAMRELTGLTLGALGAVSVFRARNGSVVHFPGVPAPRLLAPVSERALRPVVAAGL